MGNKFHEIMFTPSVKTAQEHYGSRRHYGKVEGENEFSGLSEFEADFISHIEGFYMATVNEDCFPYIQFRGGPAGFLKVLDDKTLGFADFRGNLQYISVGNLSKNNKAALFLMDYANKQRLKIIGRFEVADAVEVPALIEKLTVPGYNAKIERAMTFQVEAFDWNCPQHIPQRFTIEQTRELNQPLYEHIEKLEQEIKELKKTVAK